MTYQEINEAIAEYLYRGKGNLEIFLKHPHRPDYCNDLNAMHEAEKVLDLDQWHKYASLIGRHDYRNLLNATAAQRAEAFLKTLNFWK